MLRGVVRQGVSSLHAPQLSLWGRALFSSGAETFRAKDLVVEAQQTAAPTLPEELAFGKLFTDHMLLIQHTAAEGWGAPRIVPFGPLQLHPAAQVLHYGTCCFEGMKAYPGPDGKLRLFRPELNMARLLRSAQRLVLAPFDPAELLACIKALLALDAAWMPRRPGHSMYVRPYMFSHDGALGVHRSSGSTLAVIVSPVGPYFKSGSGAVRLFLDTHNVRAWPGGAGEYKIGGNYAPTVAPQMAAMAQHGCSQVLYALPRGSDPMAATISECGAMNMFFVFDRTQQGGGGDEPQQQQQQQQQQRRQLEVVTPPLDGTILPGVTRASVLEMLREQPDVQVSERELTVGELAAAHSQGRLLEVFGSGTACVVQPVGCLVLGEGRELALPSPPAPSSSAPGGSSSGGGGGWGPQGAATVAEWARGLLTDIQYGRVEGHPWCVTVE